VMQVCLQRLCSQSQSGVMSQRVDLPRWLTEISGAGFDATSPSAGAIGYRHSATAARRTALVPDQTISRSRICASHL
jgi:hypothetical protein